MIRGALHRFLASEIFLLEGKKKKNYRVASRTERVGGQHPLLPFDLDLIDDRCFPEQSDVNYYNQWLSIRDKRHAPTCGKR
jgi:hypothetical protein